MDQDFIKKISIIIATFNRTKYLKRVLSYYNKLLPGSNIIVADSSFPENKKINKKIAEGFSNLNIKYIDKYSNQINSLPKMADALDYINSEYFVF